MTKITELLKARQKILTIQDLGVIWRENDRKKLIEAIKYYLRKGDLKKIKKGIYYIEKDFDDFELAQKIVPVSYISFYTALNKHGVVFQYYKNIHSMALKTKNVKVEDKIFKYHQIKSDIFFNSLGIEQKENYLIASKERAICDSLYLKPKLAFDNLSGLDVEKLLKIAGIYENQNLLKEIKKLIKDYA
ncbi:MAG: hypothetical protein GF347_04200 [Candidatus Moranbacteria bacterium]|nr:hypothetical protein [Candidatus Moranbacteria bacterium]